MIAAVKPSGGREEEEEEEERGKAEDAALTAHSDTLDRKKGWLGREWGISISISGDRDRVGDELMHEGQIDGRNVGRVP